MRTAAIDFGEVRIGLAFSDPKGMLAHPHKFIRALRTLEQTAVLVATELKAFLPLQQIVIGLPLLLNGKDSPLAIRVRAFAELLKAQIPDVPILLWDERLTTAGVERSLKDFGVNRKKRKEVIDALAAASILQNYLDWKSHSQNSTETKN